MIINPEEIELSSVVGLDLETNGLDPLVNDVLVISITTRKSTYVLDTSKYSHDYLVELFNHIKRLQVVIAHNAKFDCSFIYTNFGVLLRNVHCTMLASQILENYPTRVMHNLSAVLQRYCNRTLSFSKDKDKLQKSFVGLEKGTVVGLTQLKYAAEDTKFLYGIYKSQSRRIESSGMKAIMRLENTLLPVIVKMEVLGCLIDKKGWLNEIEVWKRKQVEIRRALDDELINLINKFDLSNTRVVNKKPLQLIDMFGNVLINYSSSAQIIQLFMAVGEEPPIEIDMKSKKEKFSVGEDSLKLYTNEHPNSSLKLFLELMLDYREYDKLISTYGESFLEQLDVNNRIHTNYTQTRTKTGRLSSTKPNLQNIPGRGNGAKIREFFIAGQGNKLITCDMNGAEIAIAADYSQEKLLLDSLLKGTDMHSELASVGFSIIFGEDFKVSKSTDPVVIKGHEFVPNKLRTDNKTVTFAKFYKAGKNTVYKALSKYINLYHEPNDRLKIAKDISDALDLKMPQLSKYLSDKIIEGTTKGKLVGSKLGRVRYFDPTAYGQCANFPIQNTNAEAMKIALINIDKYLEETGYGQLVMNIHDEVVVECPIRHVEEVAENVKRIMADSLTYFLSTIQGGASVNIGDHWEK